MSRGSACLAHCLSIACHVLSIIEWLAAAVACEAIGMPFLSHGVHRNGQDSLSTAMAVDAGSAVAIQEHNSRVGAQKGQYWTREAARDFWRSKTFFCRAFFGAMRLHQSSFPGVLLNLAVRAHNLVVSLEVAIVHVAFFATPTEDVFRVVNLAHDVDRVTDDSIVTVGASTYAASRTR